MNNHRWQLVAGSVLTGIVLACANDDKPPSNAGAAGNDSVGTAGASGAGAGGTAGAAGSGGGAAGSAGGGGTAGGDPECGAQPAPDAGAAASLRLGFASYDGEAFDGVISSVSAEQMQVTTPEGLVTFIWRGPALDTAFVSGQTVRGTLTYAGGGLSPPRVSTVRGSYATAVAVEGTPYTGLSKEPGSTTTLTGLPPELPALVYEVGSCCADAQQTTVCDYSALEASFRGNTAAIDSGATGAVGLWSVTNVTSRYYEARESVWDVQVTLFGPGAGSTPDAGN